MAYFGEGAASEVGILGRNDMARCLLESCARWPTGFSSRIAALVSQGLRGPTRVELQGLQCSREAASQL